MQRNADDRIEELERRVANLEPLEGRVMSLEQRTTNIVENVNRIIGRLQTDISANADGIARLRAAVDYRFSALNEKIDANTSALNGKIDALETKMEGEIKTLTELIIERDDRTDEKIDALVELVIERDDRTDEKIDGIDRKLDQALELLSRLAPSNDGADK